MGCLPGTFLDNRSLPCSVFVCDKIVWLDKCNQGRNKVKATSGTVSESREKFCLTWLLLFGTLIISLWPWAFVHTSFAINIRIRSETPSHPQYANLQRQTTGTNPIMKMYFPRGLQDISQGSQEMWNTQTPHWTPKNEGMSGIWSQWKA